MLGLLLFAPLFSFSQSAEEIYIDALALKNDKKTKDALVKFQEALSKSPEMAKAQYEIGWCQNDLSNYTAAITATKPLPRFMQLMRQLRDREVEVAGSNMVSCSYPWFTPELSEPDRTDKT